MNKASKTKKVNSNGKQMVNLFDDKKFNRSIQYLYIFK